MDDYPEFCHADSGYFKSMLSHLSKFTKPTLQMDITKKPPNSSQPFLIALYQPHDMQNTPCKAASCKGTGPTYHATNPNEPQALIQKKMIYSMGDG